MGFKEIIHSDIPEWIRIKDFDREGYMKTLSLLSEKKLNTICMSGNCPNRYECFSEKTATFMILGNVCTRDCAYCNVEKGIPKKTDRDEPKRVAEAAAAFGLKHVVVTCVTRDDLDDGGAFHFARTLKEIKRLIPQARTEALISDFNGNEKALETVISAGPDIINHNLETVKELFPELRPKADYNRSLMILRKAKSSGITTKSGIMIGLGESLMQIRKTIQDIRETGCDIITIGQYLRPGPGHAEARKYHRPEEFDEIRDYAVSLGFRHVVSGPLVRSSYRAGCIE